MGFEPQLSMFERGNFPKHEVDASRFSPVLGNKKNCLIITAVGVIIICCLTCAGIFFSGFRSYAREKASIEKVLDKYMTAMADKDAAGAYDLFSPRTKKKIPLTKLKEQLKGNNYIIFRGYQSLSVENLTLGVRANTNPESPQGVVASGSGKIIYDDGFEGIIGVSLEKVEDIWMISSVNITIPPDKIPSIFDDESDS